MPIPKPISAAVLLLLSWASSPLASGAPLTDANISNVRSAARERCAAFFAADAGKPFVPAAIIKNWNNRGDFTRHYNQSVVLFAFRAFQLGEQIEEANRAIRDMCQYHLERPQTLLEIHSFPWTLGMLPQLLRSFGPHGTHTRDLITAETRRVVLETMWAWAREKSKLADAEVEQSQTWFITDSENHHANHFSSCWAVSLQLAQSSEYRDRRYNDGHTAGEHLAAWTNYLKVYLLERARKGMTIEIDSPSYASATLTAIYRIYDLTDDPVLKQRAGHYITLFWALWAEHQINGTGGGAKTRTYPDSAKRGGDFMAHAAAYLLGIGSAQFVHASMLPFVISSWEMPDVLLELARDVDGRGTYEIRQRRIGLAVPGYRSTPNYRMRTDSAGILRYSFCTPDYVMGSFLTEARAADEWAAISSQNRWTGVIFRGERDARVFPSAYNHEGASIDNGHWTAQAHGTLIAQKLQGNRHGDEWRVWFSQSGLSSPGRQGRWVFAEAPGAFVAVHVVRGEFDLPETAVEKFGRWLVCRDQFTPVILEVQPKASGSFTAFQQAVLKQPVTGTAERVEYTGLAGDHFTFFADQTRPPVINGQVNYLSPALVFDSPFIRSAWNSGVVEVRKGNRKLVLDFNR